MKVLDDIHKKARANGLFMCQVCAEAGIHPAQVSRWRKGKVRPLYDSVLALEEALERLIAPVATPEDALAQAVSKQTGSSATV